MKHTLIGMGNPLLDISTECGMELLDKYGLKLNNAILAGAEHVPLYAELVEKYPVEYIAGGATQNTIRVAQWMSSVPGFAAYIGAIGDDEFGAQLSAAATRDGVTPYYHVAKGVPTGTCAVLVHDAERSLVANLSAAEKYDKASHFDGPEVQAVLKEASIFYSAGFFMTHAVETMVATGQMAAASGGKQIYCMNLSAPFLCQFFKEQMHRVLPFADFVFGNESEAAAFAENNGMAGASIADIALAIAALPKASGAHCRTVIITQGADATVVAREGKVTVVPVAPIPKEAIVDTNGAGDAFVGGFLAFFAKGAGIEASVHAGHFAAGHILQKSGCVFDKDTKYAATH